MNRLSPGDLKQQDVLHRNVTDISELGLKTQHINPNCIYVVGDSMGAYGTWDIITRNPNRFAAAIAAAGSGPSNITLSELPPLWCIHGQTDKVVPNALPNPQQLHGAGTLGVLAQLDPTFINTQSTSIIHKNHPSPNHPIIYTEIPHENHATVAMEWTTRVPGILDWLFAQEQK